MINNQNDQIQVGYKETDVGIIPEDWEVINLGSIGGFSKGRGIKKDEASSGEIPCIRYGEIYTHHNDFVKFFNSRISSKVARTSRKLKKGEILFAGSGETKEEIGKCVAYLHDLEAYAGGDIVILTPTKGNSMFLGYLLNSLKVNAQKASRGQGDAIVHISSSALSSVVIPIPQEKKEQEKIAEALSDIDSLISKLDQLIQKMKNIKQGAMQELLTGKRRLPGFSGEWVEKKLEELIDLKNGYSFKSDNYQDGGKYLIVTIANVQNGHMDDSHFNRIASLPNDIQAHQKLSTNDLLISMTGNVGRVCRVTLSNCLLNQRVGKIVSKGLNELYLFYLINRSCFLDEMILKAQGGAQGNIGKNDILSYSTKVTENIDEQIAISRVLSDFDKEIDTLKKQRDKYQKLKQGMLQQLLTGKIRLV